MRVIGGQARGRRLLGPKGLFIRPTADRVREALFNILGDKIAGADFLDLYAGSGSVSIEALSRGAAATLVEQNPAAIKLITTNLAHCGFREQAKLIPASVNKGLSKLAADSAGFDIIFIDPPYEARLIPETLDKLVGHNLLKPHTLVIAEHHYKYSPPAQVGGLKLYRESKYGQTKLSFYREYSNE
jgi:16S rRNA (guanine(966)-N(2))-methyltransferase RsmD